MGLETAERPCSLSCAIRQYPRHDALRGRLLQPDPLPMRRGSNYPSMGIQYVELKVGLNIDFELNFLNTVT
jgi:hypothetical protein